MAVLRALDYESEARSGVLSFLEERCGSFGHGDGFAATMQSTMCIVHHVTHHLDDARRTYTNDH